MTNTTPLLYSVKDAQAMLCLSRAQIYALMAAGALTGHKAGGKRVFKLAELQRFVDSLPETREAA